ncbi:MAG: hypothetical protein OXU27_14300, partial [Candidatus Poribacteria bacterium]|nr:hypothetical protein [Candidatus Poribacteria bacterium]
NYASVRDASEAMSIHAELNVSGKTLSSVDDATDDVLLIELLRRGYDVAQLLEKKDTPQPFQLPADEESSVISV